jgi:prefoldin alpha subunit
MDNDQLIQQKYLEFQQLQQQLIQKEKELEQYHQQIVELNISINAVKKLEKEVIGNEVLVPIANGIFFKAELKNNQNLIVNVGSATTVEKKPEEVIEMLNQYKKEINEIILKSEEEFNLLNEKTMNIYKEIELIGQE